MNNKITSLKEKLRVALTSTAKVISEDFTFKNNKLENSNTIEIDDIKNPNDFIPQIINWLDWDWDEKYLSPHQNKRNVYTASSAQIRKKFYLSSIGIWKKYKELLEPAIEIIKTNKILGEKVSH